MNELTRTIVPELAPTAAAGAGLADQTRTREAGNPDAAHALPTDPPGYTLLDEIGHGGMGIVYRARDLALNREVAVKLLQAKYAPDSGTAVRFVEEARITGQLQHPGIPAVYQVGTQADGRPFLAMKLIRGETLETLLKSSSPPDPLTVFEAIGQAVGYAHAHGVIHRDLKPANIMVGAFGEVQVMDWGLAKVLVPGRPREGPTADPHETGAATEIRTLRDTDGDFTQAGSVLGTPAYMPPEQAAGELDKIDTRSDVFGLGAILCVLLTGKPPFDGKDAESVRLNAIRGKTDEAFARLDSCSAAPDVIALCKRCLALEPTERPASANEVASAIAALRREADERAQVAEQDKLAAEVRAAEQVKRRRAVQWAAAAVAVVLVVGIIGTTLGFLRAGEHAQRANDARDAAEAKRAEAETERDEKEKARVAEEVAKKNAIEAQKNAVEAQKNALAAQKNAEQKQKEAEAAREVTTQQRRLALDTVRDVLLRVDDLMKNDAKLAPLRIEIIRRMLVDVDQIRDHAQKNPLEDRTEAIAYSRLGEIYLKANRIEDARLWYSKCFDLLEKAAKNAPDDLNAMRNLAFASSQLAEAEWRFGNGTHSLELRRAALELRRKQLAILRQAKTPTEMDVASAEFDIADSLNLLAFDELRLGDPVAAIEHYTAADKAFAALPPPLPNFIKVRRTRNEIKVRLADAHSRLGRLADAEKLYRDAITDRQTLLQLTPPRGPNVVLLRTDMGQSRMYLGDFLLMFRKDRTAALVEFAACRDLFAGLLKENSNSLDLRQRLAATYYRIGIATTDADKAREAYAECLKLREELAKIDPKDIQSGVEVALVYARLGRDDDATRTAEAILKQAGKDPQSLFQTACAYSILSATAKKPETATKYRDRAFDVLRETMKAGWKDRGSLEADPDFDPIRDDPRFKELLKALPASPGVAPRPNPEK